MADEQPDPEEEAAVWARIRAKREAIGGMTPLDGLTLQEALEWEAESDQLWIDVQAKFGSRHC